MRNAFADEMTKICREDARAVLLSGDIGNRLFDRLKEAAPDRFFNCGVAEANMIGLGAGMALSGWRPVAYTITPFITTRVLEQIRIDVCYHNVPMIIVGVGGGLSYAALGPTHHALEDIAFLRALPNMAVLCPGDAMEVRACLRTAMQHDGPSYIRLGKKGEPVIHAAIPTVMLGRSIDIRPDGEIAILAVGNLLPVALDAADKLAAVGIAASVTSVVSVKPLDTARLRRAFEEQRLVVTVEEHSAVGGFGSAVAEWMVDRGEAGLPPLLRIAAPDAFYTLSGSQSFARTTLGLDATSIAEKIIGRLGLRA
ncbi:transketolase family protein [Dongia sp.]|uniref:transketolase family protein n=1 Tax=Dongia sp. TaxID=1977262 RepID=UPI0035B4169B